MANHYAVTTSQVETEHPDNYSRQLVNKLKLLDWKILVSVALLILIGLIMVYSSTSYLIEPGMTKADPMSFLTRQLIGVIAGMVIMMILIMVPHHFYRDIRVLLLVAVLVFVLLTVTWLNGFIGGGAQSWISIFGLFSFQPSEFAKISILLLMAWLQTKPSGVHLTYSERTNKVLKGVSYFFILGTLAFILQQPDMGMIGIIFLDIFFTITITKGSRRTNLLVYVLLVVFYLVMIALSNNFGHKIVGHNHMIDRVVAFVNPFNYSQDAGYQLINGFIAIANGGLLGLGLGNSQTKHGLLPAAHTDFIIAIIAEEFGLIGASIVLFLLAYLVYRILKWAARTNNLHRRFVLLGLALLIAIQSLVNIAGVLGLLPLTGVTLPFVSYGGSSMLLSLATIGIVQNFIIEEKVQRQARSKGLRLVHSR